ncbi:hypothetical protein [Winogradskyella sp. 3972H.M.0a.05]|uniref:hypothetical protein n=1 Tax=Winogradskyella sp. 3972H.M.0a.05 TaxID=2950277 RepID=UPI0033940B5C
MKHWKTLLALALMVFAIYFKWNWFWALLIFLGLVNVLATNEIHFVETIKRKESPAMYWVMVAVWTLITFATMLPYLLVE